MSIAERVHAVCMKAEQALGAGGAEIVTVKDCEQLEASLRPLGYEVSERMLGHAIISHAYTSWIEVKQYARRLWTELTPRKEEV